MFFILYFQNKLEYSGINCKLRYDYSLTKLFKMQNKTNPTIKAAIELKEADRPQQYLLDKFQKSLDKKPTGTRKNKHQGNSEYLPISEVQNLLNKFYLGRWQTKNFQWTELHSQLCGTIELWIFNPITKEWKIRTGAAATQIRCKRETGEPIPAGLTMDLPRLKADCIKNAAKGLGKIFGRDLNRDAEAKYNAQLSSYIDSQSYSANDVVKEAQKCTTTAQLLELQDSNPHYRNDAEIREILEERKQELQRGVFK